MGWPGDRKTRKLNRAALASVEVKSVARDRGIQWGAAFLPVGDQFIERTGLKYGTREYVCAHLRSFLDNAYGGLSPF